MPRIVLGQCVRLQLQFGSVRLMSHSLGGNEDKTIVHNCGGSGYVLSSSSVAVCKPRDNHIVLVLRLISCCSEHDNPNSCIINRAGDTNKWCCAGVQGVTGEGEDCCSTKATTTLESFPYSTVRVIKAVSRPTSASSSSPTPPSSPSSTPPSSSLSTTSSSASLTTQQPLVSDPSKASPLISPTEALPPSATAIQQPSDSRNIAIGAGVGVPLGILALGATAMLLYRDRRVKKQIRQLQEHLRTGSEIPLQQNVQGEAKAPSYVYGEAELETGIDRAELRASDQSHEAPGRQLYEMR